MPRGIVTCLSCIHSRPAVFSRGQARNVGWACERIKRRIWPDRQAPECDMFEVETPPNGWQPEIDVELL